MLGRSRLVLATARSVLGKNNQSILSAAIKPSRISYQGVRYLSSNDNKNTQKAAEEEPTEENKSNSVVKMDYDEYDDYEPKTAGQKVAFYSSLFMRLALLAAAGVCIFFTAKELFPGRMSPNSLFSEVFELLQYKEEVSSILVR